MLFGDRNRKQWHEMTRGEIVAALIAFTLIGGAIGAKASYDILTWHEWSAWMLLWPAPAVVFVVAAVGTAYVQAIGELRRRPGGS
jgi:hypothetical protein